VFWCHEIHGFITDGTLVYLAIKAQGQPISGLHIFISVDLDIVHGWLAKKWAMAKKIKMIQLVRLVDIYTFYI